MIGKIVKIEDDSYDGKDFKRVALGDGTVLKVKQGREGYLKNKWGELIEGQTYEWEMGIYKDKSFVKDFKVTSEAPPPDKPTNGKPDDMSKDDWAEKDRVHNFSIESQVAYKGIIELACSMNLTEERRKLTEAPLNAALDWAMAHFKPSVPQIVKDIQVQQPQQKSPPEALRDTAEATKDGIDALLFATPREFKAASGKTFGFTDAQTDTAIKGFNLTTREGQKQAWAMLEGVSEKKGGE